MKYRYTIPIIFDNGKYRPKYQFKPHKKRKGKKTVIDENIESIVYIGDKMIVTTDKQHNDLENKDDVIVEVIEDAEDTGET